MFLYVVHGNTYYDDKYGYEAHLFGVCTQKDSAEVIKGIAVKELYEKEMKKKVRRSTVKDVSDIEVEILEIEADKNVNIELGGVYRMIKLENVVLASTEQMKFIIQGMRNPMNSWEKSDSGRGCGTKLCAGHCAFSPQWCGNTQRYVVGENDHSLMQRLSNAGTEHRKYMRMMPVYVRITAPLYWWKEFDTYKIGTVANSCSTMHKIAEKEFTLEDFSYEHLDVRTRKFLEETIKVLNDYRKLYINYNPNDFEIKGCPSKKDIWWQMIQLLPSSYNQTRNVMLNYEVLANIYRQRKNHKLDEWREFCKWIEGLPYSELVTGGKDA